LAVGTPATVRLGSQLQLRPGLLFASIAALFCLTLEIDLIKKLDSLSLYLTYSEIALDAGVALLLLFAIAALWWVLTLTFVIIGNLIPGIRRYARPWAWYLGLTVPLGYFLLRIFDTFKLLLTPRWHPGPFWGGLLILMLVTICVGAAAKLDLSRVQSFARTRLAPIAWLHIGFALIAVIVLWKDGVYLFHDYIHTGRAAVASQLPDIYLVTFDALRADDTSLYGYHRSTTPRLEQFAKRSFTFDYFFANCNFTTPATTSIETGKLPWSHRTFQFAGFLRGSAQQETMAEALHQRGYYTAMISSNALASPSGHRTLQGYDAVEYIPPLGLDGMWSRYTNLVGVDTEFTLQNTFLERFSSLRAYVKAVRRVGQYPSPAEAVFNRVRQLLQRRDIAQPRFLWAHIYPPHYPYFPPPPYRMQFLPTNQLTHWNDFFFLDDHASPPPAGVSAADIRARYDEMVLYADHTVGDFLDWLDQTGRLDRAIVIVSSDHGESFEHGWFGHTGPNLYNDLIHIPLLIHVPGQRQGLRIDQIAQQADLLPTLLDLVGAPIPSWTDGTSLKPVLEGKRLPQRSIFSMNLEPDRVFDPISKGTVAIIDDEYKYVNRLDTRQEELYRYPTDAEEAHNLIGSEPAVAKRMRDLLFNKLEEVNKRFASKL
jgi:arylsulfatase A-like enzyme